MPAFYPPLSLLLAAALLAACSKVRSAPPPPASPDDGVEVSPEAFRSLRWLEGRWQGSIVGATPVYVAHEFENDTLMRTRVYAGGSFSEAVDSGTIVLSGGRLLAEMGEGRWVADVVDDESLRLVRLANAPGEAAIRRLAPDRISVRWLWHDEQGGTQRRTFTLRRAGP